MTKRKTSAVDGCTCMAWKESGDGGREMWVDSTDRTSTCRCWVRERLERPHGWEWTCEAFIVGHARQRVEGRERTMRDAKSNAEQQAQRFLRGLK